MASPVLLLSRVKDASDYSFSVVVPGENFCGFGGHRRCYSQVDACCDDLVKNVRAEKKGGSRLRQFVHEIHINSPLGHEVQHADSSSSSSMLQDHLPPVAEEAAPAAAEHE